MNIDDMTDNEIHKYLAKRQEARRNENIVEGVTKTKLVVVCLEDIIEEALQNIYDAINKFGYEYVGDDILVSLPELDDIFNRIKTELDKQLKECKKDVLEEGTDITYVKTDFFDDTVVELDSRKITLHGDMKNRLHEIANFSGEESNEH